MASLTIVSGRPGSGKTTLAASLAQREPRGLHIEGDVFYTFPAHPIDPTRRESHAQNTTIIRATARAAGAFVDGGYTVFLDGIFGPWFLATLLAELPAGVDVSYVLLRVPESEALRRVRAREGRGMSGRVRATVAAFESASGYESHVVDTFGLEEAAVLEAVATGLAEGRFRLGPEAR